MLISQRIVKDPSFLSMEGSKKVTAPVLAKIRTSVINSVKFLVDTYGVTPEGGSPLETQEKIFGGLTEDVKRRKEKIFFEYARPCFPLMCIESKSFLLLVGAVRETPTLSWRVVYIHVNGRVMQYEGETVMDEAIQLPKYRYAPMTPETRSIFENSESQRIHDVLGRIIVTSRMAQWIAQEVMVFVNCQNVQQQVYSLSKKEAQGIAKVLLPKFTYRVLDVFRERKVYKSLEDISDHLWADRPEKKTRSHLVRGHFKKTRTGLYWWNAFVRCRKNQNTVGVVDKDYRIDKEERT